MPAYFDTGFSVREPMWHRQGLVLDDYPTDWSDARVKAGLLWEPRAVPAFRFVAATEFAQRGDKAYEAWKAQFTEPGCVFVPGGVFVPLQDHKLIERDDTGDVLGVVGDAYELLLHAQMGELLEAILGLTNVKFETAGSCRNGAQVWALAYLDEPYKVFGDDSETYPFLALLNAHDGSGAAKVTATQVRVVCWNTYNQASMEGDRHGRQFVFRHTAGIHDRIAEAKQALAGVRDDAAAWSDLAEDLFTISVDDGQLSSFVDAFLPMPIGEVVSDRVKENVSKAQTAFRNLYLDSPTCAAHKGTGLGLVDASVEYLDHLRGYRNSDTYLGRTLLRPEPLKARAVQLVREVCSV